jgi:hypothetical protein
MAPGTREIWLDAARGERVSFQVAAEVAGKPSAQHTRRPGTTRRKNAVSEENA